MGTNADADDADESRGLNFVAVVITAKPFSCDPEFVSFVRAKPSWLQHRPFRGSHRQRVTWELTFDCLYAWL